MLLLLSLFGASFLAATILPFSSEIALIGAIQSGAKPYEALFVASLGNVLAIVCNYYLGYFLYEKTKTRLFRSKSSKKAYFLAHKYAYPSLFLSWLPLLGDPLTLAAGMFRVHFGIFIAIAGTLRILRYCLIVFGL